LKFCRKIKCLIWLIDLVNFHKIYIFFIIILLHALEGALIDLIINLSEIIIFLFYSNS